MILYVVMTITTHFAATTVILVTANAIGLELDSGVIAASYILGVGVDVDHILFYGKESVGNFSKYLKNPKQFKFGEINLHSPLQEPVAFVLAILLSSFVFIFTHNISVFIPALCLGVHILLDSLLNFENYLFWPFSKKGFRGPFKQNFIVEIVASLLVLISSLTFNFQNLLPISFSI